MMYASIHEHKAIINKMELPVRERRKCGCGCGKKSTHAITCNGIVMATGCELSMFRFRKIYGRKS